MDKAVVKNPVVVRGIDDPELTYFETIDEALYDRFDILWDEEYEGWDADGHRFELRRKYPLKRWWHWLYNVDRSYLTLVTRSDRPSDEISRMLVDDLHLDRIDTAVAENDIAALIRIGLDKESGAKVKYLRPFGRVRKWLEMIGIVTLTAAFLAYLMKFLPFVAAMGIIIGVFVILYVIERVLDRKSGVSL